MTALRCVGVKRRSSDQTDRLAMRCIPVKGEEEACAWGTANAAFGSGMKPDSAARCWLGAPDDLPTAQLQHRLHRGAGTLEGELVSALHGIRLHDGDLEGAGGHEVIDSGTEAWLGVVENEEDAAIRRLACRELGAERGGTVEGKRRDLRRLGETRWRRRMEGQGDEVILGDAHEQDQAGIRLAADSGKGF